MPFQLSPGVQVVEKDFSAIVPTVSSSTGAFAGPFAWGPVEDPVRISSETELVSRFGLPNDSNFTSFFTAANFLAYTNSLFVARTDATNLKNAVATRSGGVTSITGFVAGSGYTTSSVPSVAFSAPQLSGGITATGTVTYTDDAGVRTLTGINITSAGSGYTSAPTITIQAPSTGSIATATAVITLTGVKIKNVNDFLADYTIDTGIHGAFAAKFPGSRANEVRVMIIDAGNWATTDATIKNAFAGAPGTSDYAEARGISDDEMHIIVLDTAQGTFTGAAGTVLEKYSFVSKLRDAKSNDGAQRFWKGVINSQSKYIWALGPVADSALSIPPSYTISNATRYLVSGINTTATFTPVSATESSITINDTASFDELAAFKAFWDVASDKASRQITITGTASNNKTATIKNITTALTGGNITSYVITISGVSVLETATGTVTLESVLKSPWNVSSESFIGQATKRFRALKGETISVLSGGVDDFNSDDGKIIAGFGLFSNTEEYDISLIPTGKVSPTVAQYVIKEVAAKRRDCVAFVSPNDLTDGGSPIIGLGDDATTKMIEYRNAIDVSNTEGSYAVMDSGFKYQYDRYKDVYRFVPLNGDIAGLCARTDFTADPWFSPGGYTRGQIKNVVKLAFNPSPADRDALYPAGINPVVTFPGQGTVLFGDKTLQSKPSAFDRINVRRLFIVLEKSIATAAKFQLFEFNDSFTRAQFRNLVEPFLRDVQGRRGVVDFLVKCDESNNPGEIIDRNEFVADIFIKPNRSINYITLNFVAARSSVSFEEIGA